MTIIGFCPINFLFLHNFFLVGKRQPGHQVKLLDENSSLLRSRALLR